MSKLILPDPPAHEQGPVKAWSQSVVIDSYMPLEPDKNPMFLDKRVYQGSSGRVYPLPVIDRIADSPVPKKWEALHIENQYIRLMVLPEIGGRIHVGLDKSNGYDFFYRQNVIKPALVGLAGPWISGGVEFNWPQHHRPATFMPVQWHLEHHPDGARTIWLFDHDPLSRLSGMHGVTLRPGEALVELQVRLFNRTVVPQTFLWWANVGVHVDQFYQSFFPPDVHFVADHARRAISRFPQCDGHYYGVDYGRWARERLVNPHAPASLAPDGSYPPNDLSWYANIPVPTSYMAVGSKYDFSGGYDHKKQAGIVSVANHHIAPGKKQWTWGNSSFGHAWNRHLTDADGPYIELMTGVYTDNQPDFSFLAPGETRCFTQYWYPIAKIGTPICANEHAAVSLRHKDADTTGMGIAITRPGRALSIRVGICDQVLYEGPVTARVSEPGFIDFPFQSHASPDKLHFDLFADGQAILSYHPTPSEIPTPPPVATEPPSPARTASHDELYLTGVHLEQYRHATREPADYWRECLRRDPGESRCLKAMGLWHLKRGEFRHAADCLERSIARLTSRNANPNDGEPFYLLGLASTYLQDWSRARDMYYKATWNRAWQGPAYLELARLASRSGDWPQSADFCRQALAADPQNMGVRALYVVVLRRDGAAAEAEKWLDDSMRIAPLDACCRFLRNAQCQLPVEMRLDAAHDMARAGLWQEAIGLLDGADDARRPGAELPGTGTPGTGPIVLYTRARFEHLAGYAEQSQRSLKAAVQCDLSYCFPSRLEDIDVLEFAINSQPDDGGARYLLGNLLYDRKRWAEACSLWEQAAKLMPNHSVLWRNVGLGRYNVASDGAGAWQAYREARRCSPADARLLYEQDQLAKRLGHKVPDRLAVLQAHMALVEQRDDLSIEYITLLNDAGRMDDALRALSARVFQPWEGGEGLVLEQFVRSQLRLGTACLARCQFVEAQQHFAAALNPPENLGEAWHPLANQSHVFYWRAVACAALDQSGNAAEYWQRAAESQGDFQQMAVTPFSEKSMYQIMSLHRLGQVTQANALLRGLIAYADELESSDATVDYFATSLPTMLLFNTDIKAQQLAKAALLRAQGLVLCGKLAQATTDLERLLTELPAHSDAIDLKALLAHLPGALYNLSSAAPKPVVAADDSLTEVSHD